jgi:predicted alpha/beta hydrolase
VNITILHKTKDFFKEEFMTTEDQDVSKRKALSEVQNTFSDLADTNLHAAIVVALREDGELISSSFGNVEHLCLLSDTAKLITLNKLGSMFKEV